MPKRTDIHRILVIGSGPIVIGQAAEFDYAGTQACLALREEGYEVILINSNPATIMTDTVIADKVYMEPLTLEYVAKLLRYERPDAILPGLGGQLPHFLLVVRKAAAGAPQGEGRAQHHGIADLRRGGQGLLQGIGDHRGQHRLAQAQAQLLEFFPVLRHFDGFKGRAQDLHLALV